MSEPDAPPHAAPSHAELIPALAALRLGVQPSDLHGSLSGYLCAGARAGPDDWLDRLELAPDSVEVTRTPLLQALYRHTCAQFEGAQATVEPLLPAATQPLPVRADALVEWCRGFLGGFGLGGATAHDDLPVDVTAILSDLGTIAASRFAYDDEGEDEQAFMDVLAFVRMAAALLRREIRDRARAATRTLH